MRAIAGYLRALSNTVKDAADCMHFDACNMVLLHKHDGAINRPLLSGPLITLLICVPCRQSSLWSSVHERLVHLPTSCQGAATRPCLDKPEHQAMTDQGPSQVPPALPCPALPCPALPCPALLSCIHMTLLSCVPCMQSSLWSSPRERLVHLQASCQGAAAPPCLDQPDHLMGGPCHDPNGTDKPTSRCCRSQAGLCCSGTIQPSLVPSFSFHSRPALHCPALHCPALPCPSLPFTALPFPSLPCPPLPCPPLPQKNLDKHNLCNHKQARWPNSASDASTVLSRCNICSTARFFGCAGATSGELVCMHYRCNNTYAITCCICYVHNCWHCRFHICSSHPD